MATPHLLCDDCSIHLPCDIKNFTNLQIQMSNPNVLLVHIKCQMFNAHVQIYHPPHDYGIMFNIQQNFITFKSIKFEPHVQV